MQESKAPERSRLLFWLAFVAGAVACTVDGINHTASYGWLHPISVAGVVLGGAAVLLAANVLLRSGLDDRTSLLALLSIIAVKVVLARLYGLSP